MFKAPGSKTCNACAKPFQKTGRSYRRLRSVLLSEAENYKRFFLINPEGFTCYECVSAFKRNKTATKRKANEEIEQESEARYKGINL